MILSTDPPHPKGANDAEDGIVEPFLWALLVRLKPPLEWGDRQSASALLHGELQREWLHSESSPAA